MNTKFRYKWGKSIYFIKVLPYFHNRILFFILGLSCQQCHIQHTQLQLHHQPMRNICRFVPIANKLFMTSLYAHKIWIKSRYVGSNFSNNFNHTFCTIKKEKTEVVENLSYNDFEEEQDSDEDFSQYSHQIYLKMQTTAIKQILLTSNIPRKRQQRIQRWKKLQSLIKKFMSEIEDDSTKEQRLRKTKISTMICFMHPFILGHSRREIQKIENYGFQTNTTYAQLRNITQLIKSQFFVDQVLKKYPTSHAKHRAFIIKFITMYHMDNVAVTERLLNCIRNFPISIQLTRERHLIYYWTEVVFLMQQLNNKAQLILQEEFKYIIQNIYAFLPEASPIDIKNFISTFKSADNLKFNMKQILQTDKIIQPLKKNSQKNKVGLQKKDDIILLYIASKLLDSYRQRFSKSQKQEIKNITSNIYDKLRKQAEEQKKIFQDLNPYTQKKATSQDKVNFYRSNLLYINYLLSSFRSLHQYDPQLYQFCEQFFFSHLHQHFYHSIEAFTCERVNLLKFIIKGIMSQPNYDENTKKAKVGNILKQHRAFMLRFVQKFKSSNMKITIAQFLRILHLNQSLPIKSRAVKRVIISILQTNQLSQADQALSEIILQKFAKE